METQGGLLISQVKQWQGRVFTQLLEAEGLSFTGPQGRILFVLWQQGTVTMGQLSSGTGLAGSGLTSTVERMVQKGLLERYRPPENRRQVWLRLTPAAQEQKQKYERVSQQMGELFYRGFSAEEIAACEGYLARLLQNLKEWEAQNG